MFPQLMLVTISTNSQAQEIIYKLHPKQKTLIPLSIMNISRFFFSQVSVKKRDLHPIDTHRPFGTFESIFFSELPVMGIRRFFQVDGFWLYMKQFVSKNGSFSVSKFKSINVYIIYMDIHKDIFCIYLKHEFSLSQQKNTKNTQK